MGKPVSVILEEIVEQYFRIKAETDMVIDDVTDFNMVRDKIVVRLVNYEKNKEQLAGCPHRRYLDLAVTYRYLAGVDQMGMSSSLITNEEYAAWNIGQEELYRIAMENTIREFPWQMDSLINVLMKAIMERDSGTLQIEVIESIRAMDQMDGSVTMYVLTNNRGLNGATCILYETVHRIVWRILKKFIHHKVNPKGKERRFMILTFRIFLYDGAV